jgi:Ca-activated chloride channel family protein
MKRTMLLSICLFLCLAFAGAQEESKDVRFGNKLYKENKFQGAEAFYKKGLAKNNQSFEASFNLGNTLYRQKKYTDAADQFVR